MIPASNKEGLTWGYVLSRSEMEFQKPFPDGREQPDTIYLNDLLLREFNLHFDKHKSNALDAELQVFQNPASLLMAVTYFHELAHVIQRAFRLSLTPPSRRDYAYKGENGHSGDWVEQHALGGELVVYWEDETQVGQLQHLSGMAVRSVMSSGARQVKLLKMGESCCCLQANQLSSPQMYTGDTWANTVVTCSFGFRPPRLPEEALPDSLSKVTMHRVAGIVLPQPQEETRMPTRALLEPESPSLHRSKSAPANLSTSVKAESARPLPLDDVRRGFEHCYGGPPSNTSSEN